ncbi:class I SAM-dependent RNA methyltransferase [soil metagenome]
MGPSPYPDPVTTLEVTITGVVAGGDGLARADDGKVVFVTGALPGERVTAEVTDDRGGFARAALTDVLDPSPDRVAPPCRHVARGCGGCGWQHVAPHAQPALKVAVVVDALRRIGRIDEPAVVAGPVLVDGGRTTVRGAVVDGRFGFRRRRSHDVVTVDDCAVTHPMLADLVADGRFHGATEVTLRAGAGTGERLVLAQPTAARVQVPDDVVLVGTDELKRGRHAWYHEEVAGRRWRISATSFFQARPDGADALVDAVRAATADRPGDGALIDLCCGVGLFAATVCAGRPVVGLERHGPAVHDARHNLADLDVRLVRAGLDRWRPSPADVVIADPARSGPGAKAVRSVAATGASRVVLVSCDPAALGRDARLLHEHGYRLVSSTLVDMFPQTPHIEVVSRFDR